MSRVLKTAVFCGGRGASVLLKSLSDYNRKSSEMKFEITAVVNAYDNGLSTGKIRKVFKILGPSDIRKNLETLLDSDNEAYQLISRFFSIRTGSEWELTEKNFKDQLTELVQDDLKGTNGIFRLFLLLPGPLQTLIKEGILFFLNYIRENRIEIDYNDFSIMNAAFAGLIKKHNGNFRAVILLFEEVLPVRGRVLINSEENLMLYGVREFRQKDSGTVILDEAAIVEQRSSVRMKDIFLFSEEISDEERKALDAMTEEELGNFFQKRNKNPRISPELKKLLETADLIIYAPGTQHSSLFPTYLTEGLSDAIRQNRKAHKIFFSNIGEDADITNYTAAEIIHGAFSYLKKNSKDTVKFGDLFTALFINKPKFNAENEKVYVQPNLSFLEKEYGLKTAFITVPDNNETMLLGNGNAQVFCADLEDDAGRGRHSAAKILNAVLYTINVSHSNYQIMNNCLTHGAVLFDVDETILEVRIEKEGKYEESLLESPMRYLLAELLEKGFRFCTITGNDLDKFRKRFIESLVGELKKRNKLHLISNFEVFANGAASHIFFTSDGEEKTDDEFNQRNQIPEKDFEVINKILTESIQDFYEARENASFENFAEIYDTEIWKYQFDSSSNKWQENGKELPYIEERAFRSMFTLKPLPSKKHIRDSKANDLRNYILGIIRSKFNVEFGLNHEFEIKTGGWSSIDITRRNISKANAVQHYLEKQNLKAEEVLYFGNEFRAGGNDQSVVDKIGKISVVSVNQPEDETFFISNILYGGDRGVYSTMHHISDILEIFKTSEKRRSGVMTPVIQQKIHSMYRTELLNREKILKESVNYEILDEIEIQKQNVRLLNQKIRMKKKNTVLIIPAAGKGSRLQSEIPKPLVPVLGKESIAYVLDNFSELTKEIVIVIRPEHRKLFEEFCIKRRENILLVEQPESVGEGKTILDSLQYVQNENCDVIIAWSDLVIASKEKIAVTLEKHCKSEAVMTFPTMSEKNPYVSILKERDNTVRGVRFSELGETEEYGEHDCSFFVIRFRELQESLQSLHSAYFDPDIKNYRFEKTVKSEEFKFLYILEELARESKKVIALPIAKEGEFMSFNTMHELKKIEDALNRERALPKN